jgi:hypothetical protein
MGIAAASRMAMSGRRRILRKVVNRSPAHCMCFRKGPMMSEPLAAFATMLGVTPVLTGVSPFCSLSVGTWAQIICNLALMIVVALCHFECGNQSRFNRKEQQESYSQSLSVRTSNNFSILPSRNAKTYHLPRKLRRRRGRAQKGSLNLGEVRACSAYLQPAILKIDILQNRWTAGIRDHAVPDRNVVVHQIVEHYAMFIQGLIGYSFHSGGSICRARWRPSEEQAQQTHYKKPA